MRQWWGLLLGLWVCSLGAQQIEVTAQKFMADEEKGLSRFEGDVKVNKGKDRLSAQTLVIYFDQDKQPLRFEAKGKVTFQLTARGGSKTYEGKADRAFYNAQKEEYRLVGHAVIEEKRGRQKIEGGEISFSQKSGSAKVLGQEGRPVKFIFSTKEKE